MSQTFHDLGLAPVFLETLAELDYHEPTPIQAQAIPPILACGYVSRVEAIGLAGVFLLTLSVAALSFYRRHHRPD